LTAGFPSARKQFDSQFQILSLTQSNQTWILALQPRQAAARAFLPELRLFLAAKDFMLTGTELTFKDGSRMRNDFTNIVVNPPLDEKLFEWTPPPDFTVTEPLAK
jgi:outer membrane lipoprotein-sorting protein